MFGILNIDKPKGMTSRDVVNRVQRRIRPIKVGHAGTLDPLARGVLVMPVGAASRLVPYLHEFPKSYRGTFQLGKESPSEDVESEVTEHPELPVPSLESLKEEAAKMIGDVMQMPPVFSALKVKGRRSYDLARAGEEVKLEPRPIQIHRIEILSYEFPELQLEIDCGTGTYIRSIGRDLAIAVGTRAVMSDLVRTSVGPFQLESAIQISDETTIDHLRENLHSASLAVGHMQKIELNEMEVAEINHGRLIRPDFVIDDEEVAAVDASGRLRAILIRRSGGLGPRRVFKETVN